MKHLIGLWTKSMNPIMVYSNIKEYIRNCRFESFKIIKEYIRKRKNPSRQKGRKTSISIFVSRVKVDDKYLSIKIYHALHNLNNK